MMAITVSLNQNKRQKSPHQKVYGSIRQEWVAATPEEIIRQKLIQRMIHQLDYPRELIVVEKSLKEMPHLETGLGGIPDRRVDIVCFAKGIRKEHPFFPLLVIECKAVKLTSKVFLQIAGYNYYLNAFFISAVNEEEILTGWKKEGSKEYHYVKYLPKYGDLIASVRG